MVDKFEFHYTNDGRVIAVGSYAGKSVRGVAKCNPKDTYVKTLGEDLALARLTKKIAEKRLKAREKNCDEAFKQVMKALEMRRRASASYAVANREDDEAAAHLAELEARL